MARRRAQKGKVGWLKPEGRLRPRRQGSDGRVRYYGDFRDYADVGGKQEALIAFGERYATTDPDVAAELASERVKELDAARRRRGLHGNEGATLGPFAALHLVAKKRSGEVTDDWLAATEGFLQRAVDYFSGERELDAIRPSDVRAYVEHLRSVPIQRGGKMVGKGAAAEPTEPTEEKAARPKRTMSNSTLRAHLFALSNLYARAQESEVVPVGYNPVAALMEKPSAGQKEAKWLEVHDAALLLESARTLPRVITAAGEAIDAALAYPLLATFLLTGGRQAEVLGLELDDVSFERRTVIFRPNTWRRLKTQGSWRVVPLWPQLAEMLQPYLDRRVIERGGRLVFPAFVDGAERMLVETRKLLDRIAKRAGWRAGEIRHKLFRHSYCAARLQTLDHGAPVSPYTVSRELGHGSEDLVRRVYGHVGMIRHRAEAVEYRVEQHRATLGQKLTALESPNGVQL